jgi:hypothetical protein
MRFQIEPQPVRVGPATISLNLTGEQQPIAGARVQLEANMSHPGMAPVFSAAKEVVPGQYRGAIEFTMAGDWVILVRIELTSGEIVERQVDVKGVRPQ